MTKDIAAEGRGTVVGEIISAHMPSLDVSNLPLPAMML
jgi:hypothetical protein